MTDDTGGTQESCQPTKQGKKWPVALAVVFLAVLILLVVLPFPLWRDMGFVCEHTASRKGYREWFMGLRTNRWYSESRLERFMAEKHPHDLTHRWVSFMGTGRDFLGQPISYRHGRPNETLMLFRKPFDDHVDSLDDAGTRELYRVLTSGQTEEIEAQLAAVRERFFEPFREPRPQEGP